MKALLTVLAVTLPLAGCMLGPDFRTPESSVPERWPPEGDLSGTFSQVTAGSFDPEWWMLLSDPLLADLQKRAMASNLDLQVATTRLQQSRAELQVATGEYLPELDANGYMERQRWSNRGRRDPSGRNGKPLNHGYDALSASWELDIWGKLRRNIESADALLEASAENQRAVLLMVQAETARSYIQLRGEQAMEKVIRQNIDIARHNLELTQIRYTSGVATNLELAQAEAQLATIEARLPPNNQQQTHLVNALSFLVAAMPDTLRHELEPSRDIPVPPLAVPLGLPSELARRRPDIRAAEARLHAATANIGVARADFYPQVTLNGTFGFESSTFIPFHGDRYLYSFGPSFTVPLFKGGRLQGRLALREAQQQEAAILYQRTVLDAWREVDNALVDYRTSQQQQQRLDRAVVQNRRALDNARLQYVGGAVDFLNVLNAQQAMLGTQEALIYSQVAVSSSLVTLYRVLGGGWTAPTQKS